MFKLPNLIIVLRQRRYSSHRTAYLCDASRECAAISEGNFLFGFFLFRTFPDENDETTCVPDTNIMGGMRGGDAASRDQTRRRKQTLDSPGGHVTKTSAPLVPSQSVHP